MNMRTRPNKSEHFIESTEPPKSQAGPNVYPKELFEFGLYSRKYEMYFYGNTIAECEAKLLKHDEQRDGKRIRRRGNIRTAW